MHTVRLAGTLMSAPSRGGDELRRLPAEVDLVEVRADRIGHVDADWLRSHFGGRLLFTLRSTAEGGAACLAPDERHRRLVQAASQFDLVDLEAGRDLVPAVLQHIPRHQRAISWSGPMDGAASLRRRAEQLVAVAAGLYRLVPTVAVNRDGLDVLQLLRTMKRRDLIAFAAGEAGFWTRLLAPYLGAPLLFGTIAAGARSLSEPTLTQLVEDYGPPPAAPGQIFGIVGHPVAHSLSPQLHNAAYRALGFRGLFLPFQDARFDEFWRDMIAGDPLGAVAAPIKGLTVVSPHKQQVLAAAAEDSPIVRRAGSANIVVRHGDHWRSATTDPEGVIVALRERRVGVQRKTAVVGCGGAGCAVAAALTQLGADVTLVNRGLERGASAQRRLQLPFTPLAHFSASGYSTVINATPVGRQGESLPFDVGRMRTGGSVVDLAYGPEPTPLMQRAGRLGLTAVDGREVCMIQVRHQFRLMTGLDMPRADGDDRYVAEQARAAGG